ncbi:MAG: hypothetical protein A2328_04150 [Bdellovibrionales bacterium RIFOXYB2_FULL_36_6]|nr:MAG: hypothetical protein A2328_04150 [Bdellovibrionales bacterium RIFOXYB2_FULL_36_6]
MKKEMALKTFILTILCIYACFAVPYPSHSKTSGVKTSYKRYSILKYKDEDILCEPYIVTKNDWLYKILRKKGEISEKDFPHFINIFKEINPQISNIDAIEPGINILIPLKKVNKEDYNLSTSENVDVPVIEFSSIAEDPDLQPFLRKHSIQNGETVEKIIDKEFLQNNGDLSEEGLKIFQLANPNIKNINILYEGTDIYLPDPSIRSQPWFRPLISGHSDPTAAMEKLQETTNNKIEAYKLAKLKKYSALIGGVLLNQGKLYFPGGKNSTRFIDLSTTPVIETPDERIIITSGDTLNDDLLENIQSYWKNLKTQLLFDALEQVKDMPPAPSGNPTLYNKKLIQSLLSQAGFEYTADARIPFTLHHISLEASFGRVLRKDSTDLLINFGNVYGSALEVLEKREFEIISVTPEIKPLEMISILFSRLGYSTWQNPSFYTDEIVEKIGGLYAVKNHDKLFIPLQPLSETAAAYLKKENVRILSIDFDTSTSR